MQINKELIYQDPEEFVTDEDRNKIQEWIDKLKITKLENGKTLYEHSGKRQGRTPEQFYYHMYFGKITEYYVHYELKKLGINTTKPELIVGKYDKGDLIADDGTIYSVKSCRHRKE